MSTGSPKVPKIDESERTSLVTQLLEVAQQQTEIIQELRDEIAVLKGNKPKPKFKPSKMETGDKSANSEKQSGTGKRPGSAKKKKTSELLIHKTTIIPANNMPQGSQFKGYKNFVVQGIIIEPHNTLYRMERWQTPDGSYVQGEIPKENHGHFSASLVSYILYQYHQCHVTQPLLLEQLREIGIRISSGQLNRTLELNNASFHAEKTELLTTGLAVSPYIQVDDTGAPHQGKTGICTYIGNDWFAWFQSTRSKSRINFLELLRNKQTEYTLNEAAFNYRVEHKLASEPRQKLQTHNQTVFANETQWQAHLADLGITKKHPIRTSTEGALIGSIVENGLNPEMVILSDDAGQFNILLHALCWVHAERLIHKLIAHNEEQRLALDSIRGQIWDIYAELKIYKLFPSIEKKHELQKQFEHIFTTKTCFVTLNLALKRLHKNKRELLLVLDRPEIPLHNNTSESDIREYAKRRKISSSTRSEEGRKSRDTFISLKKTCRKLGISFWHYLQDRVGKHDRIPRLSEFIHQKARLSG